MKRAVVTGANGFVGSHLVRELSERQYEVYAVVRDEKSDISGISGLEHVEIIYCPLERMQVLEKFLPGTAELFFHFAWAGTSGDARADYRLQLSNVEYTCDAVKAASRIGCRRFVFAGSIMEYEASQYLFTDGAVPGMGYVYSTAKLTADYMAKTVAHAQGIEYVNVIISNIYGEGEISKRFIHTILLKMLKKEHLGFTSGEQWYDFIYVTDAVKAILLAGERGTASAGYYIGNKEQRKLKEFITEMRDIVSPGAQLHFGEIPFCGAKLTYREFDPPRLYEELGFACSVSFADGIRRTSRWLAEREGL